MLIVNVIREWPKVSKDSKKVPVSLLVESKRLNPFLTSALDILDWVLDEGPVVTLEGTLLMMEGLCRCIRTGSDPSQ